MRRRGYNGFTMRLSDSSICGSRGALAAVIRTFCRRGYTVIMNACVVASFGVGEVTPNVVSRGR